MRRLERGITSAGVAIVILILTVGIISVAYISSNQGRDQQLADLKTQIQQLRNQQGSLNTTLAKLSTGLPVMDQTPTQRLITVEWAEFLSEQDRFFTNYIVVNQGDTVDITYISNDTAAHTFTLDAPYNYQINGSIPGTVNDVTGVENTTPPTHNSPGVTVAGGAGNVTAHGSFVAKDAGIFEYYCVYHIQLGMFGFLVVLPNAAYHGPTTTVTTTTTGVAAGLRVSIPAGSGTNTSASGFSPDNITLVVGLNNTVTWTNDDTVAHTVTALDGSFNSQNLPPGASFTFTFTRPGTYSYGCEYHPWMKGTVFVKA